VTDTSHVSLSLLRNPTKTGECAKVSLTANCSFVVDHGQLSQIVLKITEQFLLITMTITFDNDPNRHKKPWRKSWQDSNGKQRKKYFATEQAASKHTDDGALDAKKVGTDFAAMSKRDRQTALLAMTLADKHGFNLVKAAEFYMQHNQTKEDILMSDAWEKMMQARKGYRPRTEGSLRCTLRAFANYEDLKVSQYSREDVLEFCHANEVVPATKHKYVERLNTFFVWAVRQGYAGLNPCKDIDKDSDLGVIPPRNITYFTFDEVKRLMQTALEHDPALLPYFVLGIYCGIRPSEITGDGGKQPMTWSDILIDEDVREVNVPSSSSKTHEPRQVELSNNAIEWLQLGGELPPRNIRDRRIEVYTKAGVKWEEDIMRHTFASYHCRMYRAPERLKLEMGHSKNSQTLFNHYRSGRVTLADAKKFWTLLPDGAQNILNPALSA